MQTTEDFPEQKKVLKKSLILVNDYFSPYST